MRIFYCSAGRCLTPTLFKSQLYISGISSGSLKSHVFLGIVVPAILKTEEEMSEKQMSVSGATPADKASIDQ